MIFMWCSSFFGISVSINRLMTVCNLKTFKGHSSISKIHILVTGNWMAYLKNRRIVPFLIPGTIVIFVCCFFLKMALDDFDQQPIPVCIGRLAMSRFLGAVFPYAISLTNILPAFVYFGAFLLVYIQYKINKNQETNTVIFFEYFNSKII